MSFLLLSKMSTEKCSLQYVSVETNCISCIVVHNSDSLPLTLVTLTAAAPLSCDSTEHPGACVSSCYPQCRVRMPGEWWMVNFIRICAALWCSCIFHSVTVTHCLLRRCRVVLRDMSVRVRLVSTCTNHQFKKSYCSRALPFYSF